MITNKGIDRGLHTLFLGPLDFSSGVMGDFASVGAGAPVLTHFNSLGVTGFLIAASGDLVSTLWPFPAQIDEAEPIELYVHFFHVATDADAPVFKFHYKEQTAQAAGTITSPTTVTFAAHTCSTTANSYERTAVKTVSANSFTRGSTYIISLECDDISTAEVTDIYMVGLEMKYTPSISLT